MALPAGESSESALLDALTGKEPVARALNSFEERTVVEALPALSSSLTSSTRSDPSASGGPGGVFSGLLAASDPAPPAREAFELDATLSELPASAASSGKPGFDQDPSEEFKFHFPSEPAPASSEARRQGSSPPSSAPASNRGASPEPSWSEMAEASASAPLRRPAMAPAPAPATRPADSETAAVTDPHGAWSAVASNSFGEIERAFQDLTVRPPSPRPRGGLTAEEERFLRGDDPPRPASPPPRPPQRKAEADQPERPAPPPRPPGRKGTEPSSSIPRPRATRFELSAEARELAFLPAAAAAPRGANEASESVRRPVKAEALEQTAPSSSAPPIEEPRPRKRRAAPARPKPSPWQGLGPLRVAALVVLCAAIGAAGGALTAPRAKPASTARARAELKFADGNRFYLEGRYDDALGAFRGALSIDPTFGAAHRAKGAALAKLERWDDAYLAYEEYLKLEPQALDASDVKGALARRGPPPSGVASSSP